MSIAKKLQGVFALALVACLAVALVGCGQDNSGDKKADQAPAKETIKVGASPAPHAEILQQIEGELDAAGYTLEVVEYSDYIQPNVALSDGTLDANYFQHITYLEDYNKENGTDLANAGGIHFEPLGLYAGKTAAVADLADGAQIAVPSDPTNEARALLLLEAEGLITLKEGVGLEATPNDIADNPKNLDIVEAEAASLPRTLEDVDMAVINGNYAISADLDPTTAVASEETDSEAAEKYVNVIAVRAGDEASAKTTALVDALKSDKVKAFIDATYNGSVVFVG